MAINSNLPPIILKYEHQLEDDPNSLVFAALAEAYRKIGDLEHAFSVLKDGIKKHPTYKLGYFTLANCYFDVSQYQLAYTTIRPFIGTERDNFRLQKLFGEICLKLNQKDEALDSFKYCLFLIPRDQEIAEKIKILEEHVSPAFMATFNDTSPVIKDRIAEPIKEFKAENLNNVRSRDIDIDNWIQIDSANQRIPDEDNTILETENWSIKKPNSGLPETAVKEEKALKPAEFENQKRDTTFITHTLVDLYLNQGLRDKAVEVLEKILILAPEDKMTLKRLQEIKNPSEGELKLLHKDQGHLKEEGPFLAEGHMPETKTKANFLKRKVISRLNNFMNSLKSAPRNEIEV